MSETSALISVVKGLRNRVVSGAAPGIAAKDAPDGQAETFDGAVLDDGFLCILRACRCETAGWWGKRTDASLVENNGYKQQPFQ